jgi:hypothetical protein
MKNLLYLFFAITLLGCSSNDDTNDVIIPPATITFTLREIWKPKVSWDRYNLDFTYNREICSLTENTLAPEYTGNDLTGFETYLSQHFSIDTLVINLTTYPNQPDAKFFDFRISQRFGGVMKSEPKTIGHIEFIGFNEESRLILEHALMDYQSINGERYARIDYFSSNLSEDFIESITYDGQNNNYYVCTPKKVFYKRNYDGTHYEFTTFKITVPEDADNLVLGVGDKIGRMEYSDKNLGEGWDAQYNNSYLILDKE